MTIYMIPGLAADARLFSALNFGDKIEKVTLKWLQPAKNETLEDYARRLVTQIDQARPFVLLGVSLGGILAQEVAKHVKAEKVIIISSVKTKKEFPPYFQLIRLLRLHKLFPANIAKKITGLLKVVFGKMSRKEYSIFKNMLLATDNVFIDWAEHAILNWKNEKILSNLVHIHGTDDKVFPARYIKNAIWIEGGGHYMIMHNARKLSQLVKEIIDGLVEKEEK
jgi:pimeloyl-ACP methyl ester carboxylesterase